VVALSVDGRRPSVRLSRALPYVEKEGYSKLKIGGNEAHDG